MKDPVWTDFHRKRRALDLKRRLIDLKRPDFSEKPWLLDAKAAGFLPKIAGFCPLASPIRPRFVLI
jgi:hypothetical protein